MNKDIICQFWWLKDNKELKAIAKDRQIIISPTSHFYLDNRYSKVSTKKVYTFKESDFDLESFKENIAGVECAIWSEWIKDSKMLEYVMYPRLLALSEVAWTSEDKRSYNDFNERLEAYYHTLLSDVEYCMLDYSDKPGKFERRRDLMHMFGRRGFEYKEHLALRRGL